MFDHDLPAAKPYFPTTFLERGVAVPFTTPLLGGTRARPSAADGLELVVPNPSGGRGVYIMPWRSITALCRPTLHDRVFNERIAVLDHVTPAAIRRIARQIAADGLAGEEATQAALAAARAEEQDRTVTNFRLLMALVEQTSHLVPMPTRGRDADPVNPAERARITVAWVTGHLRQPPGWAATALEALADTMTDIGVAGGRAGGRIPRIIDMLTRARGEIAEWSATQVQENQAEWANIVCASADLTLSLVSGILSAAQAVTDDMLGLLRRWQADAPAVRTLVGRPQWLLDGWEQICLIWFDAQDDARRRSALDEIVGVVPILPREVGEWCDNAPAIAEGARSRRLIPLNEDWLTGALLLNRVARNERIRALTC